MWQNEAQVKWPSRCQRWSDYPKWMKNIHRQKVLENIEVVTCARSLKKNAKHFYIDFSNMYKILAICKIVVPMLLNCRLFCILLCNCYFSHPSQFPVQIWIRMYHWPGIVHRSFCLPICMITIWKHQESAWGAKAAVNNTKQCITDSRALPR